MNSIQIKHPIEKPDKQGQYATTEEAIEVKSKPLVALLKKLNIKVIPAR